MPSITGVRIGGIGFDGIDFGDAKPKRDADVKAGDVPVWFEAKDGAIEAKIGNFGTTVSLGEGQSSSMNMSVNGSSLDVRVDDNVLVVNGHAFDVKVAADGSIEAKSIPVPSPKERPRSSVTSMPLSSSTGASLSALDQRVTGNLVAALDSIATKPSSSSSELGSALKSMSWDSDRVKALKTQSSVAAADLPSILAAFSWDSGRIEALATLAGKVTGGVDAKAALATFSWDSDRAKAEPLLASLG
jgi:hypothetical protein